MRLAIGVEYHGANFFGWQRQKGVRTAQEELETALSEVANSTVSLICAGRTDAGVHALGQVATLTPLCIGNIFLGYKVAIQIYRRI